MGRAYSEDLRVCVMNYVSRGGRKVDACAIFQIGEDTLFRWLKQKRERGHLAPKPRQKRPHKLSEAALRAALEQRPDATLQELGQRLGVSAMAVFYACQRWKLTRKKNATVRRTRRSEKTAISAGN